MKCLKTVKFFSNFTSVCFYLMMLSNSAFAQSVQLSGNGGSELMMFIGRITNFAFYVALAACLVSIMFAGFKFSKGDQQGMDAVWKAVIGTAIVAAASGILKYWIFAAQDTGIANNGSAPF